MKYQLYDVYFLQYHGYILSVVNFMEERLRQKQMVNPDAMVDIETHLLVRATKDSFNIYNNAK